MKYETGPPAGRLQPVPAPADRAGVREVPLPGEEPWPEARRLGTNTMFFKKGLKGHLESTLTIRTQHSAPRDPQPCDLVSLAASPSESRRWAHRAFHLPQPPILQQSPGPKAARRGWSRS